MTTPIAGVRGHLADALAPIGVTIHTYPPAAPQAPAVVLVFTSRDPGAAWDSTIVGVDVRIIVNAAAGPSAAERIEALIDSAAAALTASQVQVGVVSPYQLEGDQLVADIPTLTVWKDD